MNDNLMCRSQLGAEPKRQGVKRLVRAFDPSAAACPRPPGHAADPPGPTTRESEEPEAERSRHPPGEEDRDCSRGRGDEVANEDSQAMCVRGIPHPAWSSKRCLTTQASDYAPEGEIARPRVQAGAESGENALVFVSEGGLATYVHHPRRPDHGVYAWHRRRIMRTADRVIRWSTAEP